MKPICVSCQRFYRPKHNGFSFIEGMPRSNDAPRGTANPEAWVPYKLWSGDLWECLSCGHEIIVGVGLKPIAEHYAQDFEEVVKSHNPLLQVHDC